MTYNYGVHRQLVTEYLLSWQRKNRPRVVLLPPNQRLGAMATRR
jgi:hypothetical protein